MASLKCSNCGNGIHYHDEANGTQIIFFTEDEWNRLTESEMYVSRYTLDGGDYYTFWKCPECGALHRFDSESNKVRAVYKKKEEYCSLNNNCECYVGYVDYDWDQITEGQIVGKEIDAKYPNCKKLCIEDYGTILIIQSDDNKEEYERM